MFGSSNVEYSNDFLFLLLQRTKNWQREKKEKLMANDIYGWRFCVWNERMILHTIKKKQMLNDLIRIALIWFGFFAFAWLCVRCSFGLPCNKYDFILKMCRLHGLWSLNIQQFSSTHIMHIAHVAISIAVAFFFVFFFIFHILLSILMITIASIVLQRSRHLNYQTVWLFKSVVACCIRMVLIYVYLHEQIHSVKKKNTRLLKDALFLLTKKNTFRDLFVANN